jgi:hypothetical protein
MHCRKSTSCLHPSFIAVIPPARLVISMIDGIVSVSGDNARYPRIRSLKYQCTVWVLPAAVPPLLWPQGW